MLSKDGITRWDPNNRLIRGNAGSPCMACIFPRRRLGLDWESLGLAAACKRHSTPRSWGIVILPHKHAILDSVSWWIVASYARVIFIVLLVTYVLGSLTGGARG
jgi:hypothetical protein